MTGNSPPGNPLADRRVRTLVGFVGGLSIAVVAVLFVEPPLTWLLLGVAVLDVLVTPYVLGRAIERQEIDDTTGWSGN
jgi:hypothetical protein